MAPRPPFGPPVVITPDFSSTISIDDGTHMVDVATQLTGTLTLEVQNLDSEIPDTTEMAIKVQDDGNGQTVSFGSNITGKDKTLSANAVAVAKLVKYNSGYWLTSFEEVA